MTDFWNERFGAEEYAYGTAPNQYYKEQLDKLLPGKILFPAEGEGRNAVFAAKLGWQVTAFDPSIEGKRKAEKLATENSVSIDYRIDNYENVSFPANHFDCRIARTPVRLVAAGNMNRTGERVKSRGSGLYRVSLESLGDDVPFA